MIPRVLFAGTPEFAVPSLRRLADAQMELVAVLTQPDRKKGRGRKSASPPVKEFAMARNLPAIQTAKFDDDVVGAIRQLNLDLVVVVAFGLILPPDLLQAARFGCINVHASLLPRWRGAAPVARAIESGDSHTGVSIMQLDEGLDTGPILSQASEPIHADDTSGSLANRLAQLGASELLKTIPLIIKQTANACEQDERRATYARKLESVEAVINWNQPASAIERMIRAFDPWPVAYTWFESRRLRIWRASVSTTVRTGAPPGTVIESSKQGLVVATTRDSLQIETVQKEGRSRMRIEDFLTGTALPVGTRLSSETSTRA